MILTITLNPLLEKRFAFNNINTGKVNRTDNEFFRAGGKGLNVSRQLNRFNMKNLALTFLGGNNGKVLRNILASEQIEFSAVSTKSETRIASVIEEHSQNRVTTVIGKNSVISQKEADEFKSKLEKMINNASVIVFSGSSPCQETDDIFEYGIELANKMDKVSILDTYGRHLEACIKKSPTVIHNNIEEIEKSFGKNLNDEKDKLEFLDYLYKNNIKLSFLTDGNRPAYASKFDFRYKVEIPEIAFVDPIGSGDSFVAGLTYGMEKSMIFEDFLKFGIASGTANALNWETSNVTLEEVEKIVPEIKLTPVGKKMKLIDDTPVQ
ncbi:MAG: 1-phosphofructokinase family hexose kinase [Rhodothermaceae bacterium]